MFRQDNNGIFILQWPLENNNRQKYIRKRLLGKGGFAKCYEIQDQKSGDRFACKIIDKETNQYKKTRQKVQSQIAIHKKLSHGNIVRFERYYQNEHYIYIILQLCNTTLDKLLQRRRTLHQIQARYFLYQIIQAIAYLHLQNIIHRDLKLENFLLSEDMQVKIGDFGLAAYYNISYKRKSICGTFNYMAPEIFTAKDGYSIQIDIWSLGIAAFIMLTGKFPFEDNDVMKISKAITNKTYFYKTNISQTSKDLVSSMLQLNPTDRIAVKQLLKHPFFTKYQIPKQLPLSCFVCYPAQSFIEQYRYPKQTKAAKKGEEDEQQFRFMLQSKQSPLTPKGQKIQLPYYQHISSQRNQKELNIKNDKKVCSFEYDSKRNNSCNIKKWITQFQQYSKHGILYRVNDGAVCFRFNDGSNFKVYDPSKTKFLYISQSQREKFIDLLNQTEGISSQINIKLKIFMKYLQKMVLQDDCEVKQTIYIRLYYNCHNIFIIWLNNGMIQGKFDDQSQLILDIDSCMFIDENNIKTLFPSTKINEQDVKILKKKQILFQTIRRHAQLKHHYNGDPNKENIYATNNPK